MSRNIIAILRGVLPQDAVAICEEILAAGIDRIEVPLNSPEPFDSIARIVDAMGDRALIGAGTVLSVADVDKVNAAGGRLIVSPDCNPEVIAHEGAWLAKLPGVMTPTECFAALRAGADGLKFFPGDMIGPAGLKAVRAVLPKGTEAYAVGVRTQATSRSGSRQGRRVSASAPRFSSPEIRLPRCARRQTPSLRPMMRRWHDDCL